MQTRWAFYPRGEPNVVATTFAADGCLAAGTLDSPCVEALGDGLLRHFYADPHFTYTPRSDVLIHNANLMTASLALRLASQPDLPTSIANALVPAAKAATAASLDCQRSDGSWPYGEAPGLEWIDGFHTGYVLLRLSEIMQNGIPQVADALNAGAKFYFANLFDGARPLYFYGDGQRRDGNNAATALTVAVWGARQGHVRTNFPDQVFKEIEKEGWMEAMLAPSQVLTGRLPFPRWLGAPLLDALTSWIRSLR